MGLEGLGGKAIILLVLWMSIDSRYSSIRLCQSWCSSPSFTLSCARMSICTSHGSAVVKSESRSLHARIRQILQFSWQYEQFSRLIMDCSSKLDSLKLAQEADCNQLRNTSRMRSFLHLTALICLLHLLLLYALPIHLHLWWLLLLFLSGCSLEVSLLRCNFWNYLVFDITSLLLRNLIVFGIFSFELRTSAKSN